MSISRLQVTGFRCLQSATIDFDPRFTLIIGANGSGKTSLLESIYILGRGRSFRTNKLDRLIRHGHDKFVVFGEVDTETRRVPLGIEGSTDGLTSRIGGARPTSLAELSLYLPVQIIDPEVHHLIDEGPSRRRKFLDYGTFHVDQSFVAHWQRYQQALRQRNAALKTGQSRSAIDAWDSDLVKYGEIITAARSRYVTELAIVAHRVVGRLLGMELSMSYRAGWAKDLGMSEALGRSAQHDLDSGVTQVGPHRAELDVRLDGTAVRERISRGQQKLLAAALLLAQLELLPRTDVQPTLLLDDPAAELDENKLALLISEVVGLPVQLIITTLRGDFLGFGTPGKTIGLADGGVVLREGST